MSTANEPLDRMGFYTMTDARCRQTSAASRLGRCVLVVTERCNFACPYCQSHEGRHMPAARARAVLRLWAEHELFAVLFTGGEPTIHPDIVPLVRYAKQLGIPRVGLGTNGAAPMSLYRELAEAGVDDFSISLDADNPEDAAALTGRSPAVWYTVVDNIRRISELARVTIGFVIDEHNVCRAADIVRFALSLGVDDIRVNPASQYASLLPLMDLEPDLRRRYPNLDWRLRNRVRGIGVRGLTAGDAARCWLALDEMTVSGGHHYPCFVYMREGGEPIGRMGPHVREERAAWVRTHRPHEDPICRKNCADCCIAFNARYEHYHPEDAR